ncbi:MAG: PHB depolymerase family esterase [Eubacteriales bacterium]|nr:PHB depolymerase family esterase [Eubacteriales bacterium]
MASMILRPGAPDDDNRDYLPERIKGSDVVVNENGNNSIPYPARLTEHHAPLTKDGIADTWYEYIPASYDGSKPVPLVISVHGGMMTGWGQAIYTSWTLVAEANGFIVAFPDASLNRIWQVQWGSWDFRNGEPSPPPPGAAACPENVDECRDVQLLLGVIEHMKRSYNIDPGRVYMQGMSMGNLMTALFARSYGALLAGAAGSGCSSFLDRLFTAEGRVKGSGMLPVWQSRPENNDIPPEKKLSLRVNRYNRYYWMKRNGCSVLPEISIVGENNLAFYHGEGADQVYLDIKNRDHGQTLDDAALIWSYLFSGCRRKPDGSIEHTASKLPRKGDAFAFALAEGESHAWLNNRVVPLPTPARTWQKLKYHGLNGGTRVRGEYCMAPLRFLAGVFGAALAERENGASARMTLADGRKLQFARGSIGCVIDDDLRSMYCEAIHRDGQLLVSVEWFCRYLFNLTVTECDGVVYVTDHFAELSENMADLIRDLLRDGGTLSDYNALTI